MRGKHLVVYLAAAAVLILCAGCGWSSGPRFAGEYADFDPEAYDPAESTPVTAVQAWFASMEFRRAPNDAGVMMPDPESGRDFDLWLTVVNPEFLLDPSGQFIGMEQVDALRELWNSKEWNVEFLDIEMEEDEEFSNAREAKVFLVAGGIRYIGDDFFDSPEYRQDSFGDKKGEIFLRYYEGSANDPLLSIAGFEDAAGKGRWVVMGGLDFSEDWEWGERP